MDFTSDNAAGVHPQLLAAVMQAAGPEPAGYDGDRFSAQLDAVYSDLFGTSVRVFAVPSGTAANALGLATLVPPYGGIWCHREAHIEVDEAGAIPFYSGGASLFLVDAADAKLTPEALDEAASRRRGDVHQVQPSALSLTQATECGTVYTPDEVQALATWAKTSGLRVHMDGARLANAVASLGCHIGDVTWRAGVDILSLGCIKNGGMSAEAVVLFDPTLAPALMARRKRAGLMPSKGRFAAAQLLAMAKDALWLKIAQQANEMAQILAHSVPDRLLYPVQANSVFVRLTPSERQTLLDQGFSFYEWELAGPHAARLVVRWDQDRAAVEALAQALKALI